MPSHLTETHNRKILVGHQIADQDGYSIQGDEQDPFNLRSFSILIGQAAEKARAWVKANTSFKLIAIRHGDIENPEYIDTLP
jgi:hypothetical protein